MALAIPNAGVISGSLCSVFLTGLFVFQETQNSLVVYGASLHLLLLENQFDRNQLVLLLENRENPFSQNDVAELRGSSPPKCS